MTNTEDDSPYYLPCGCYSEQPDHTCRVGGWQRPDGCHCGAPDDCYCHESCSDDETRSCTHCYTDCQRGTRPHVWDDTADRNGPHGTIVNGGQHCRWCYTDRADTDTDYRDTLTVEAIRKLTAGKAERVLTVAAFREDGSPWLLTNGNTSTTIRPRDVIGGTRVAAYRLARMVMVAVPEIASVQFWDTASGSDVWQLSRSRGRTWLDAHSGHRFTDRELGTGDPMPIGPD